MYSPLLSASKLSLFGVGEEKKKGRGDWGRGERRRLESDWENFLAHEGPCENVNVGFARAPKYIEEPMFYFLLLIKLN